MPKLHKRPDGRYQISVTITEGGQKKRKVFYGATQKEVMQKVMSYQQDMELGRYFRDVSDSWERQHFRSISTGTQVSYAPALKRASADFGDARIRDIRPLDVLRSLERMAAQQYAHHSVSIYLCVLNQIFDYAVIHEDIDSNPASAVKVPKGLQSTTRQLPTDAQLDAIRAHVDDAFGLFAFLLLYTGLRRGEALALQWRDVSFAARTIKVSKSASYASGLSKPEIKSPKTESGIRTVIIPDRLAVKLFPAQGKPAEYVFGGSAPLTQSAFMTLWKKYCIGAGLADPKGKPLVTPHQLRHAYATMLYEVGVSAKDAQHLLGHSKVDVTLDTYTHIRKSRMDGVAEKLNATK